MSNVNLEFRKIKSLSYLYEINSNGTIIRNVKSKKQLKIVLDMHHFDVGYYTVYVNIKHKVIRMPIHKAVAECWLGDRPDGYEIDHIDRNPHNNDYRNLRYVTHSEQMKNRKLSDRIIQQATANVVKYSLTCLAKPVMVRNGSTDIYFMSMTQAAYYIAKQYNKNMEAIRAKLKQRRKKIYDYDIIYLNAETGHGNSKE